MKTLLALILFALPAAALVPRQDVEAGRWVSHAQMSRISYEPLLILDDKPTEITATSATPGVVLHVYRKKNESPEQFNGRAMNEVAAFHAAWGAPPPSTP